jgi:calcineurin-like phosphoesterase family protein
MSVKIIADPHLGHKNIAKFRYFVSSPEENTKFIIREWEKNVTKNDVVYCMGDMAFDLPSLELLGALKGRKILISGNHDDMVPLSEKVKVFEDIQGIIKYKGMWLSHAPIHPDELRGKPNIHGHVHKHTIMKKNFFGKRVPDARYFNACVDNVYPKTGNIFTTLEQARAYFNK